MRKDDVTTMSRPVQRVQPNPAIDPNTSQYPGFCIVFDDDDVERVPIHGTTPAATMS